MNCSVEWQTDKSAKWRLNSSSHTIWNKQRYHSCSNENQMKTSGYFLFARWCHSTRTQTKLFKTFHWQHTWHYQTLTPPLCYFKWKKSNAHNHLQLLFLSGRTCVGVCRCTSLCWIETAVNSWGWDRLQIIARKTQHDSQKIWLHITKTTSVWLQFTSLKGFSAIQVPKKLGGHFMVLWWFNEGLVLVCFIQHVLSFLRLFISVSSLSRSPRHNPD